MLHKTHVILAFWAIGASVAVPLDGEQKQSLTLMPSSAPSVDAPAVSAQIVTRDVISPGQAPSLGLEDLSGGGADARGDLDTANTFWAGYGGYGGLSRPYYAANYNNGGGGWRRGWGGYGGRGWAGNGAYNGYGGYGGYGGWAQPYWG